MIRINLLPVRQKRFTFSSSKLIFLSTACLFLLIVFLLDSHLQKKRQQLLVLKNGRYKELRQQQRKLAQKREQTAVYTKKLDQLNSLSFLEQTYFFPEQLLWIVVNTLEGSRISFQSLELTADGTLKLEGIAFDVQTLAAYIRRLRKKEEILDIKAIQTTIRKAEALPLLHFSCLIIARKQESG